MNDIGVENRPVFNYEPKLKKAVHERILQPLSALKVDNEVVWINPHAEISNVKFNLSEATPMACVLALGPAKVRPDTVVYGRIGHKRTTIVTSEARVKIGKTKYNYIDIKGSGLLMHGIRNISSHEDPHYSEYMVPSEMVVISSDKSNETQGAATLSWVMHDVKTLNDLSARLGIDVVPTLAIAKLKQVVTADGTKISPDEAKSRKILNVDVDPVVQFRAWVTPYRLSDIYYNPEEEKYGIPYTSKDLRVKRSILLTAISDIQSDQSVPDSVRTRLDQPEVYLRWIAKKVGSQIGRMHSQRAVHKYLYANHNITLDGKIVDADGMMLSASLEDIQKEYLSYFEDKKLVGGTEEAAFKRFTKSVIGLFDLKLDPEEIMRIAREAYKQRF